MQVTMQKLLVEANSNNSVGRQAFVKLNSNILPRIYNIQRYCLSVVFVQFQKKNQYGLMLLRYADEINSNTSLSAYVTLGVPEHSKLFQSFGNHSVRQSCIISGFLQIVCVPSRHLLNYSTSSWSPTSKLGLLVRYIAR